jgi:hypothetical protein
MAKLNYAELPYVDTHQKYFIGIDPGASGGICIIKNNGGIFETFKTPDTPEDFLLRLNRYKGTNTRCFVEQVYCRPTDGVKAAFGFGHTVGVLHTVLAAAEIQYQEIHPKIWQKHFVTPSKTEDRKAHKNKLKAKAEELYPLHKVTLWSADAMLIARHCYNFFK